MIALHVRKVHEHQPNENTTSHKQKTSLEMTLTTTARKNIEKVDPQAQSGGGEAEVKCLHQRGQGMSVLALETSLIRL
jgi:hypothetical protein